MKTRLIFPLALLIASSSVAQSDDLRQKQFNLKKNLALEGYDPVSYFNKKPLEGKEDLYVSHKGVTYLFASSANLARFKAGPEKYEPAFGGWCAYAMGEAGEKVKIDPETYKILDGKLYLFYNFWGNNTLETWNENERALKSKADKNWEKYIQ